MKHMKQFGGAGASDHPDADVSTDYTKNQAWASEEVLKERWGKKFYDYQQKIKLAVLKTQGMILTYDGEPINALFHSTSGTRTASSKEVWGNDCPYLQSVNVSGIRIRRAIKIARQSMLPVWQRRLGRIRSRLVPVGQVK